ncbi:MAG TPA: hypothetical protein P5218_01360 [Planctomycetota bacterium]|nr:hypothetical protein [Planctomycetota bacterium]
MLHRLLPLVVVVLLLLWAPVATAKDLHGVVQVQQPDGLVPATGDGSIVFRVRQPGKEVISVEGKVAAGAYRVEIPEDCTYQVLATRTTEGAGYPIDGSQWLNPTADGTYDVIVRIPLDFTLQVYGSDGRTQLSELTVIAKERKYARLEQPGPLDSKTQLLFRNTTSPIEFRVTEPEYYTYYVHAPGYAWTQNSPDPFLGGVQTMQLTEGGDLRVHLVQAGPRRGQVFRIRRQDSNPDLHPLVHELKQYDDPIEIIGLAAGRYHISSEDPIRPANMPIYGEMDIEILPREVTSVELALAAEPQFSPVPAGGTIVLPAGWGTPDGMVFRMQRLDPYGDWGRSYEISGKELRPVSGQTDLYSWSIPLVAPGAYSLSFQHTSYSVYREVNGDGQLHLDFELPAPRTVKITTLDDRTQEPIFPESLTWSAVEPEAIRKKIQDTAPFLSERRRLVREKGTNDYVIYGPDTKLRVRLDDPRFDPAEWIVDESGDASLTWSVHRATALRITLVHGDEAIRWTGDARILSENSDAKVSSARDLGRATQFNVSAAGRYTIRFPRMRGFEDIPPQTVEVGDGEIVELEVPLTSK